MSSRGIKSKLKPSKWVSKKFSFTSVYYPLKGSKSKKISPTTNNESRKETRKRGINSRYVVSNKSHWKSLAMSVFCATPGKVIPETRNKLFLNL